MKLWKIILLVLALAAASFSAISSTLARYTDEDSGSDKALIAKWGFCAGATPETLQTQGFSFDVFNTQQLAPQDKGENSFVVSGGQSDVAIDYEIYLNMNALQVDIDTAAQGNQYPPLIFYIDSSQAGPQLTIHPPYDTWFTLTEIAADSEGCFKVASGHIANDSANQPVDIIVHWWWNTSFSVGTPNADPTPGEDYYALALAEYQDLVAAYNDQVHEAHAFFTQHERIVSTVDGLEQVSYSCGETCPISQGAGGEIDAAHQAAHAALVAEADQALAAVNSSLKCQYDAYDTKAVAFLKSLADSEQPGVLIKVVGSQAAPVADNEG